jgi:hypothetical protein
LDHQPTILSNPILQTTLNPSSSQGMTAPVTCAEYIDEARKDSKGETLRRERQLQAEHAKRLGIEDADQWLDGLAKANASTDGGEEVVGGNRLSGSDCHANLEVMPGGTSVRPNYKAMLDKNYLVRGERGYAEGRHYWEVTLTRFGVVGVGMHCIGVSSPGDPTEAGEQYCMGESRAAAAMMLGHCEKMRGGKTEAYGRRSVKQGDVIGVLIEMGLGEVSFFLNGVDLGVAYRGLRGPLYPAIEMGMMSSRDHYYDVRFNLSPPELKRPSTMSLPRPDTQTFAMMRDVLPSTSRKNNTQGFQSVKGPGSTGGGFGVGSAIKCYPQVRVPCAEYREK